MDDNTGCGQENMETNETKSGVKSPPLIFATTTSTKCSNKIELSHFRIAPFARTTLNACRL